MNNFEDQLRAALQRKEPPAGFAERVQLRAHTEKERVRGRLLGRPSQWLAAAALLLVTSSGLLYWQHERQVQAEGERARAEAIQALQISSEKLNMVLKKLNHINETKEKS